MKKIIDSLKYLKLYDFLSVFIFLFVLIVSIFYKLYIKLTKQKVWLIIEEGKSARDNGYHFYKYIRNNHPEIRCYYVIDKKSDDYKKVKEFGNIIGFRSFKHWLFYLTAEFNISSQKNGNPSPALFYVLHVKFNLLNNRIFLQHGVIKDMCEWLLYKNTKFRCFICGAEEEYEYVNATYGYPPNYVQYTGLARFDNLHNINLENNSILLMPTWRSWLGREFNFLHKETDFKQTQFYIGWNKLLSDEKFIKYIEKNNIVVYFYPHINMQKYLNYFESKSSNIKLINVKSDIQEYLKKCEILITDYSSVFMDFGYMGKCILYYQFDQKEYRKKQYTEGYFSYENNGFGPVIKNENNLLNYIKKIYDNKCIPEKIYKDRMNNFFKINDRNNCERIYKALINISEGK